ncbi:MAG: hypothetical protein AB7P08_17255 [Burkholderiales bacterium]
MGPWALAAGAVLTVLLVLGGVKAGRALEREESLSRDLTVAQKLIVRREVEIVELPKIVERVVTRTVTVEKEVERVVVKIEKVIPADCVLPDGYGMLLVAAANGVDPDTPGGADAFAGAYGCRETLAATLADLKSGWKNTATLAGLQDWAALVTRTSDPPPDRKEP